MNRPAKPITLHIALHFSFLLTIPEPYKELESLFQPVHEVSHQRVITLLEFAAPDKKYLHKYLLLLTVLTVHLVYDAVLPP